MTNIYIVKENYTDLYNSNKIEFCHKCEKLSEVVNLIEGSKNKSFALDHEFKIYKFELNDNVRLIELEKELGINNNE